MVRLKQTAASTTGELDATAPIARLTASGSWGCGVYLSCYSSNGLLELGGQLVPGRPQLVHRAGLPLAPGFFWHASASREA